MTLVFNIVEPTLNSYTGHCYSLVETIAQAVPVETVRIWAGRKSGKYWQGKGQIQPYFFRAIRKIQSFFLYRRLFKESGKLLLSTAGTADLMILDLAAGGQIPPNKVYLYVHWLGVKVSRAEKLAHLAKRQPNLEIMCATETTTSFFSGLGFRATTVPYPIAMKEIKPLPKQMFSHLLFAGAARLDKGFDKIVDLVEDLALSHGQWPIVVQASTTHQTKHGTEIQLQIDRLMQSRYSHLNLLGETLTPQGYRAIFSGAISIQPYSASDFCDRVSGVTMDALSAGCPVIVTANTWLARVVLKYNAGIAVTDLSPSSLRQAVGQILIDYEAYSHRAALAGRALQQEHSAASMIRAIFPNG